MSKKDTHLNGIPLTQAINEYGGLRCTAVCNVSFGCFNAHWCILPADHDGPHIHKCSLDKALKGMHPELSTMLGESGY